MASVRDERFDVAVVGAGILGLAVARELLRRDPRARVAVLEKEPEVGSHQTGHNSGVIHAGIYYAPGSLKARVCVEGARRLYEFCQQQGIAHERCGKVIVATRREQLRGLAELERRGMANGVPGLHRLTAEALAEVEPRCRGIAALHSPATGIVDFAEVARVLADDVVAAGGSVRRGCEVVAVSEASRALAMRTRDGEQVRARRAVFCAGLWADRLAVAAGAPPDPRIVPFRGGYLRLRPEARHLVRSLIYPVPDPQLPFLGVHLTRHIDGDVLLGPTALLVGARNAYRLYAVSPRDLKDTFGWPGTWRLFRRHSRAGLDEIRLAVGRRAFVGACQEFVPELSTRDVVPGPAGVRAQAVGRDGSLVDDFVVSETPRALHVRNAPSPAATSALALADLIVDRVQDGRRPR